jgi:hypothetical protein
MKGGERRLVRHRVVLGEILKFLRNGHCPSAVTAMVVFDDDINIWKGFLYGRFKITKPDRL